MTTVANPASSSDVKPIDLSSVPFPGDIVITDGNETISRVAYMTNGGIVIYTITPSSPFGEESAKRAAAGQKNIYGVVPQVFMASDEAAAASFVQGLAAKGVGSATASSSQGILLMIPEMYNAAGQLLPISFYIGARDLSRHSLTIFAGHSDVYAVRDTGIGIIFARNAQELQDLGAIAERLKFEVSLPMAVVYDGFHTTHRQTQIRQLPEEFFWRFMNHDMVVAHKARSLDPSHPTVWGTNENPDGYMQAGLAQKPHTLAIEQRLPALMKEFAELTGRSYTPYDYVGHPEATDVIVAAGSSLDVLIPTVRHLLREKPDSRIGVINVRAFRPFLSADFVNAMPETAERVAVLDRSLTHTAQDEPLCADVRSALMKAAQGFSGMPRRARLPVVTGGIYGLAGKDFHPGSVIEVFNHLDEIKTTGKVWTGFTVGVIDDIMHSSLPPAEAPDIFEGLGVKQARIVAYGSDGTVSMVKTAAKIYANLDNPDEPGRGLYIASHAEYDSKKAGGVTVSHLRVSASHFDECFDVRNPHYVAVHHPALLQKRAGILDGIREGGTFVINTSDGPGEAFQHLPDDMKATIVARKLKVYVIDAFRIAEEEGLGNKISMIMQRVLFQGFGIITPEQADDVMGRGIIKAFSKKGQAVVDKNIHAFKRAVEALAQAVVPTGTSTVIDESKAPDGSNGARKSPYSGDWAAMVVPSPTESGFRKDIQILGMAGKGDNVPVSAYFQHARGGARPVNTWRGLLRSFATRLPTFHPENCNECGACVFTCPTGGALDQAILTPSLQKELGNLPLGMVFRNTGYSVDASRGNSVFGALRLQPDQAYGLAIDPNLCTGCGVCEAMCEKDAMVLEPATAARFRELEERRHVLDEAIAAGGGVDPALDIARGRQTQQEMESLPSYVGASGACGGCYEPLYVSKFLQLFPYAVISNATGCSSIWGAQAYETPYTSDEQGYGSAWVNPLFENNAAVGGGIALGMAAETDQMNTSGAFILQAMRDNPQLGNNDGFRRLRDLLVDMDAAAAEGAATSINKRIERVELVQSVQKALAQLRPTVSDPKLRAHMGMLEQTITAFVDKKTLIVGGDGWAFDIGLQMMLHVLQSDLDVTVLVLVTDVYSNTGGQMSKATPKGMDAPFAPGGKHQHRYPLAVSVAYGNNAFVGQVNLAYPNHLIDTYKRAAAFKGPSLILCYVPCYTAQKFTSDQVAHQARRAVTTRYWPLWTFDPQTGEWDIKHNPDSRKLVAGREGDFIADFCRYEGRFRSQFDKAGNPSADLVDQRDENLRIWSLLQKNANAG